ncbi:MAG: NHL repeat-containing protein [Candidatus Eremiobacteraeota bacterium]|nr:NHL repeat-containing protein [Candidatus Eremiobacteraeota bacterium]
MKLRIFACALVFAALNACGGSMPFSPNLSAPVAAPATVRHPARHATLVKTRLHIKVPQCTPRLARRHRCLPQRKRPKFISTATQSISLQFNSADGGSNYNVSANLTPTSTGCTSTYASTECQVSIAVAADTYNVTAHTFDQANETGNVLSAAQLQTTIVTGGANYIAMTLAGLPAKTIVAPADGLVRAHGGTFDLYGQGARRFIAETVDADGNLIIGDGAPTFTMGSPSGALSGVTVSPSSTTSSAPNVFTVTPPASYSAATASFTVTPTFTGQTSDGCALGGNCSAVTVTVDMKPMLYIIQVSANDVTAYDMNGNQLPLTGTFAGLDGPRGITMGSNGLLYVLSTVNSSVAAFDAEGNPRSLSGSFSGLNNPYGIAQDPDTNWFYVTNEAAGTVSAFDAQGNQESPTTALAPGSFPTAIAFAPVANVSPYSGYLYAGNYSAPVQAYDAQGDLELTFPGDSSGATGIAYDSNNGYVYVAEQFNSAVNWYTKTGTEETTGGSFTGLYRPAGVAFDPMNKHIVVADEYHSQIFVYDESGNSVSVSGSFPNLHTPWGMTLVP